MANVNVNREVTDVFYRYKMPRIIAKVEGKGNGIKTVIVNMSEVAKALSRPPEYPTKFFGCELGAQTQFDYKNDRFIVNGAHDATKLQDLLDGFIKKFVLCPECDNPETKLTIKRKDTILRTCIACGHTSDVDLRHKVTTFILKNPPNEDGQGITQAITGKGGKSGKKGKKDKADDSVADEDGVDGPSTPPGEDDRHNGFGHDSDGDWSVDVSEEAVRRRMEDISAGVRVMTHTDDLEKSPHERANILFDFVKQRKEGNALMGAENEKEILGEAERLDVKDKAPLILAELLFDKDVMQQIKQYRTLFLRFCYENEKAQKALLGAVEKLAGEMYKTELLPKIPHILKLLYEFDIVDEEVLLDWDKKPSKKYVGKDLCKEIHTKAEPFINWLKNAEEESSEGEEEEDDEVEVVYSNTGKVGTQVVKPSASNGSTAEDKDDLDIDNI